MSGMGGGTGLRSFGRRVAAVVLAACMVALSACSSKKTTTGTASPSAGTGTGTGKTIALGAVLSLTGAGGIYGPQQKNGILLAEDEINRSGVNGARIAVTIADDQSDK